MANVYIKTVEGGENTNPAGTEGIELDDGAISTWVKIKNLFDGAPAQGEVIYFNGTKWARLGVGTSGQMLQTNGAGANPSWVTSASTNPLVCEFRLTLTSGTPVTTADVTGATNVYISPFKGNRIALYDGVATWNIRTSAEITVALGTLTSGLPYDVFVYDNAGTVTARSPVAWTNGTTRATALTLQNGVLVKTGATTDRYLGTFYTTSTTATEDSAARRLLFSYYNRVRKALIAKDTTNSWAYTVATYRASNNNTTDGVGRVAIMQGYDEDVVTAKAIGWASNGSNIAFNVGIGLDSTSAFSGFPGGIPLSSSSPGSAVALYSGYPGLGYHYLQQLEWSTATGTTTWYGDNGAAVIQSGMAGTFMC